MLIEILKEKYTKLVKYTVLRGKTKCNEKKGNLWTQSKRKTQQK